MPTVVELREEAKRRGIPLKSGMKKADIEKALRKPSASSRKSPSRKSPSRKSSSEPYSKRVKSPLKAESRKIYVTGELYAVVVEKESGQYTPNYLVVKEIYADYNQARNSANLIDDTFSSRDVASYVYTIKSDIVTKIAVNRNIK